MQYDIGLDDRLFPVTKSYLYREMKRSCKNTGVKSDFITSIENVSDFVCDLNALVGVHQHPVDQQL